jgi:hypothetical protein
VKIVKELNATYSAGYDALRFLQVSYCMSFSTTESGLSRSRYKRSL